MGWVGKQFERYFLHYQFTLRGEEEGAPRYRGKGKSSEKILAKGKGGYDMNHAVCCL